MGIEPNIIPFPGRGILMTKAKLKQELARLKEELLPYYEDDEDALDADIEKAGTDVSAVGLMSAIAWCHGELGVYELLNKQQEDAETSDSV